MKKGLILGMLMTAASLQAAPNISIHWEMIQNDVEPGVCLTRWTFTNDGTTPLPVSGWTMYYCQISVNPQYKQGDPLHFERISASSHKITPTQAFAGLGVGQSLTLDVRFSGAILKEGAGPEGAFLVIEDSVSKPVTVPIAYDKFTNSKQWSRGIENWYRYADGELLYDKFKDFAADDCMREPVFFLPRPKVVEWGVRRTVSPALKLPAEGYCIDISYGRVKVQAADEAGRYYAGQTLARLREAGLPNCHIEDWPDYPYRGFMLDIARNFTQKKDIFRLIDQMSTYRLNVLHLHLVDDEAWRLEIPGIPELTEIGSKRGYTTDERNCLLPYYGGGWDDKDPANPANGYLTRQDFIDILVYARDHYIDVIPEIDIPGHSRAAIKCMEARFYNNFDNDPSLAYQYLLTDFKRDKTDIHSAQSYKDNVIAVNLTSSLHFMDKVISEIHKMYQDAGVKQTWFHLGGDEVAKGVYTDEEHARFLSQLRSSIADNGFQPAGWEEIAAVLPEMKPLSYCWKVSQKKAQQLSQDSFPVVLSCANVLYFDHVYVRHQEETGLYWAGSCEMMDTYLFEPIRGDFVKGLQAQIFAETLRGDYKQVERYMFPRMFALSERAWNARPESAANYNGHTVTPQEWNASICRYELQRIHDNGITFHLSQPGIHVEKGLATMVTSVPNAIIRYTLDGSEPNASSPAYSAPIRVKKGTTIRAKAFFLGTESNTTWWIPGESDGKKESTATYNGSTY
ncbi:MAG: carbohydate-binding domain-containing protein [Paludibacteraceae bacterium]|nr:carbohydate-binding domain-containing protein [Paludibacteraceae bacterium]